jgi:putative (di)nucleoside polyphosphate hydrolase
VPLEAVIEFKRQVYQLALIELARILFRSRSFDLPESYRLPEAEAPPELEPVRVVLGARAQRGALHK